MNRNGLEFDQFRALVSKVTNPEVLEITVSRILARFRGLLQFLFLNCYTHFACNCDTVCAVKLQLILSVYFLPVTA